LLAQAGAVAPSVTYAQQGSARITASFYVESQSIKDAAVQGIEVFLEAMPNAQVADIEGMTETEQDRRLAMPALPKLVGPQEMAGVLGISRQRLYEVMKMPGFPAPVVQLAVGPIWDAASVGQFVETWARRPGRPRKDAALTHLVNDNPEPAKSA
jgi:predicted DNA-binding transcriptional regulator AlpA